MEEKRYNFTYKTFTNSGKYYVGRHSTNNINDGYQGSGKWIKLCKNTNNKLVTEILEFYATYDELLIAEQKLLDEHINNSLCCNRVFTIQNATKYHFDKCKLNDS